ncbi:MAG: gamma-glutamylcyclotransferase [Castellaniella sp.]
MSQPPPPASFRILPAAEREASLRQTLSHWQPGQDIWVFAYGSLIWRPEFDFIERRDARLHGYHRALCLWSRINRGTPEQPGLVFGLDHGGSCRGVAFRVAAPAVPETMDALWQREMPSGAYLPRWLACRTSTGDVRALAFVMNRRKDSYVRDLPAEQLVRVVHGAHGRNGACLEYVLETAHALHRHNIRDRRLQQLVQTLHEKPASHPG